MPVEQRTSSWLAMSTGCCAPRHDDVEDGSRTLLGAKGMYCASQLPQLSDCIGFFFPLPSFLPASSIPSSSHLMPCALFLDSNFRFLLIPWASVAPFFLSGIPATSPHAHISSPV